MPEKNHRIQKRLEKRRQNGVEYPQKTRIRPRKASYKRRYSRFSTQMILRIIIRSLILVTVPRFNQVKNIAFKALHKHLKRMKARNRLLYGYIIGDPNIPRTVLRLNNGSRARAGLYSRTHRQIPQRGIEKGKTAIPSYLV